MLTFDQIQNASLDEIMNDARELPSYKQFRLSNENDYYNERDKWYIVMSARHDGINVEITKFSESGADLLTFVRDTYTQFLKTLGMGLPAAATNPALTYTPGE